MLLKVLKSKGLIKFEISEYLNFKKKKFYAKIPKEKFEKIKKYHKSEA